MFKNLLEAIPFAEPQEYPAGEVLFRERTENAHVYLIVSGFVDLVATNPQDGVERSISWRGPGQLVGDSQALLATASPLTAKTATPCILRRASARTFAAALTSDRAPVLWHLVRARSRQLVDVMRTTALFASANARERLEYVLWRLGAQQRGPSPPCDSRLTEYSPTNRELAGYIGVNPTYVPALFTGLQRDGLARRVRGFIVMSDFSRLYRPPGVTSAGGEPVPWKKLLDLGTPRRFEPGYSLFQQNDPPEDVYIIDRGFVDLSAGAADPGPHAQKPLWWAYDGELLGDASAVLETNLPVTAITRTRSFLHQVSARAFLKACDGDADPVLHELLVAQSQELHACTTGMALLREPLHDALEHVLIRLASQHQSSAASREVLLSEYSPSNAALAGYIGTEERYISHLLHQLKAEQVAWRGQRRLLVVRPAAGVQQRRSPNLTRARAS